MPLNLFKGLNFKTITEKLESGVLQNSLQSTDECAPAFIAPFIQLPNAQ